MAEYINIRGQSIEVVASDPANPTLGQIWYNSTSNTLKGENLGTSWTAIASLNTPVQNQGGFGTTSLALSAGGSPPVTGATELYDGSTWSSDATMNTARSQVYGSGSVSAGLLAGGFTASPSTAVEEYTGAGPVTKTITVS